MEVLTDDAPSRQRMFLLDLAQEPHSLGRLAAIRLAEHGVEAARPALWAILRSPSAEVFESQFAASLLYKSFGESGGLAELIKGLSGGDNDAYPRMLGAFSMVSAERRNTQVVELIVEALQTSPEANQVVSLMRLLDGVADPPTAVIATLRSFLTDRRRAKEGIDNARTGRVRDFAAFHLARLLKLPTETGGHSVEFPTSFFARRRLRQEVLQRLGS